MTVKLQTLKSVKNSVIGNPSAKLAIAQDQEFVTSLVDCLNHFQDDIRVEAAHIISSLSYGSPESLHSLLLAQTPRAFLYAMSHFTPTTPTAVRSSFARALRALAVAIAEVVGPSLWGLRPDEGSVGMVKSEAKAALAFMFQEDSLDIYLPFLVDASPQNQVNISIAQLLGSALRSATHRKAIAEWLPPAEREIVRAKDLSVRSKRGWEKQPIRNEDGWVARNLAVLLRSRDIKLQEAALSALAALVKDNTTVAGALIKSAPDSLPAPLQSVLSLTKSRSTDVQLAACLCATHIIRASDHTNLHEDIQVYALTIIHVINRMIGSPPEVSPAQSRTKACFILYHLVTDDRSLCHTAFERGSLEKLDDLVKSITPLPSPPSGTSEPWDEDEPESVSCLREAALTAIAALTLLSNDTRRSLTDDLHLLPFIHVSLSAKYVGVRYAACQCVRSLSRAVSALRTSIVDSGLGMGVFAIFKREVGGKGKGEEDRRVIGAALAAVCNIVNEFSPLRPIFLDQGLMPRLVQLLQHSGDPTLRLSALWAIKNLLRKTSPETKRDVMSHLGWRELTELLDDPDDGVKEQAFNVVRNMAENEAGIDMIFREMGATALLNHLTTSLASSNEDVVLQAAFVLANVANGCENHQSLILSHPEILKSLHACLGHANAEIRKPAVACVLELARANPKRRKAIIEAGIVTTLRRISERSGSIGISPGGHGGRLGTILMDDDKEVIIQAKTALDWLERGGLV